MAKFTNDYTITVLSESITQYNTSNTTAPLQLGPFGPINLRKKCVPYVVGTQTALDLGLRDGPCVELPFQIITLDLQEPGAQTFNPSASGALGFDLSLPLQTPGAQTFNPSASGTLGFDLSLPLQTPGAQTFNPSASGTLGFDLSLPLQTPGAYTTGPLAQSMFSQDLPLQTPGAETFAPSATGTLDFGLPLQTPGAQTLIPEVCPIQIFVDALSGPNFTIQDGVDLIPTGQTLTCPYEVIISGSHVYQENVELSNILTTTENTVTLMSWPGTIGGGNPMIDGGQDGSGEGPCCLWVQDVDNVIVDSLQFHSWSYQGATWDVTTSPPGWAAIYLGQYNFKHGITNITIKDCNIEAQQGGYYGIYSAVDSSPAGGSNREIIIKDCVLNGTGSEGPLSGSVGIWMQATVSSSDTGNPTIISSSIINSWSRQGISVLGNSGEGGGPHIIQNYIYDCPRTAIYVADQSYCEIVNNEISNCNKKTSTNYPTTIQFEGEIGGIEMYYNTLVCSQSADALIRWEANCVHSEESFYKNNLYRYGTPDAGSGHIYDFEDPATLTNVDSDYNLFSLFYACDHEPVYDRVAQVTDATTEYPGLHVCVDNWATAVYAQDEHSIEQHGQSEKPAPFRALNPYIFDNGTEVSPFSLNISSSVALDSAGIVNVDVDILGNPRPVNDAYDIGAYEKQ